MTPYPRGTLRSLLTAHAPASSTLSSSFDAAAFLSYRAFLLRLARETRARATEEQYGPRANVGKKGKVVVGKKVVRRANKVRPCGPRSAAELTDVWVGSVGRVEGAQGLSLAGSGTTTYSRDWMAAPLSDRAVVSSQPSTGRQAKTRSTTPRARTRSDSEQGPAVATCATLRCSFFSSLTRDPRCCARGS